jgi:hypothetical protein
MMQLNPGQQSPLYVQPPPASTQVTVGGAHLKTPLSSGTQGTGSQQSAAEAQVSPVIRHVLRPLQRGMPKPSSSQTPCFLLMSPQQLFETDDTLQA